MSAIEPYGARGFVLRLSGGTPRERARRAAALARAARLEGADAVVGAEVVASFGGSAGALDRAVGALPCVSAEAASEPAPIVVPVAYDGPDLDDVAKQLGVPPEQVITLHAATTYEVELLGFLPGFGYLGEVDERLRVPRHETPRAAIDAGAVGLADRWTGIYPTRSPGGWRWIGRALGRPWLDPDADPPVQISVGARVRFEPADARASFDVKRMSRAPGALTCPRLRLTRVAGLALIEDLGRPGLVGMGLPPSGAADPRLLVAANRALGNADGAAGVEVAAGWIEVEAVHPVHLALSSPSGVVLARLAAGERLRASAPSILGLEGGIGAPTLAGSRSTLLAAGLGGLEGRALRRGDELERGDGGGAGTLSLEPPTPRPTLTFDPGPDARSFPAEALSRLEQTAWVVSPRSDRVGVRLEGPPLPRGEAGGRVAPFPMCRGAVEVTTDGTPIILGPDHPTTGGYPVLAVLRPESAWDLARLQVGDGVRLRSA